MSTADQPDQAPAAPVTAGELSKVQTFSAEELPAEQQRLVLRLLEERLVVKKQWHQAGALRIRKWIESRSESLPVELIHEELEVEHVPLDRPLADDEQPIPHEDGDTLIIPVIEEQLVVTKRRVLREELRVTRRQVVTQQQVSDTLRSEQIRVEPSGNLHAEPSAGEP